MGAAVGAAPCQHGDGVNDPERLDAAWEAVSTVRWTAERFELAVSQAVQTVMDVAESVELPRVDPSLDRAMTVMIGVLAGMRSAREMLGWLHSAAEPPAEHVQ